MLSAIFKLGMPRMINNKLCLLSTVIQHCIKSSHSQRFLNTGKTLPSNYEGDGKTTVTILNREYRDLLMIDSVSAIGFRLNNGILVLGPMAIFPKTVLQWNVSSVKDITPGALSLFCLLEPKLDILIIGTGDKKELLDREALEILHSNKLGIEILSTENAISTFNFLNAEGRCVAGAFIPPAKVVPFESDLLKLTEIPNTFDALIPDSRNH